MRHGKHQWRRSTKRDRGCALFKPGVEPLEDRNAAGILFGTPGLAMLGLEGALLRRGQGGG
jgi:hypothetical protein